MPPEPLGPGPAVEPGMPGGGPKQVGGHVATLATVDAEACDGDDVAAGGGDDDAAGAGAAGAGAGA